MRIVRGIWAGKDLVSPGRRVRPTAEEVRARWLDLLGPDLRGARVLDLFAGSGAVGLEALSRGASAGDFVENGPAALHALKANVASCRKRSHLQIRVFKRDAIRFVEALEANAYDVVFADPPYGSSKLDRIVDRWTAVPFSRILSVEHAKEHILSTRGSRFDLGETSVTILRFGRAPGRPERRPS